MCDPNIEKQTVSLYNVKVLIRNCCVDLAYRIYKARQERGEKYAGII